jgi:hypothetical protein
VTTEVEAAGELVVREVLVMVMVMVMVMLMVMMMV